MLTVNLKLCLAEPRNLHNHIVGLRRALLDKSMRLKFLENLICGVCLCQKRNIMPGRHKVTLMVLEVDIVFRFRDFRIFLPTQNRLILHKYS